MNPFLDAAIRSSAVLTIGLAAAGILRRQPASLRHWVLAAALALAAAQPVISRVLPSMQIAVPGWATAEFVPDPVVETSFSVGPIDAAVQRPAMKGTDWPMVAVIVWAAGALASLAMLLCGMLWLSWLGWTAAAAGERWREAEEALREQFGIRRRVRMLITGHPALLVTWGAVAPVILLPADANHWPADRVRLVVAHEMAHLRRRDWLVQLVAEMTRAINWCNPLFWFACARLRRESEHACDDIVLDLGIGGTSYASHLVDLARTFSVHGRTWLPAPSIARPSTLERRVRAMLNPQVNRRPVSLLRRAALAAILAAIALPIAAASQSASTASGTVVDPSGRPLGDAVLRMNAVANIDQVYETRSDANGAFQFAPVPPGEYMLSVRSPGFSGSRQRLLLRAGEFTITLKAQVGTLRETVTVVGGGKGGYEGPRAVTEAPAGGGAPSCSPTAAGQLTPPTKVRDVRPRYKQEWIDAKAEGAILMQARIGIDGTVRGVDVISPVNAELEDEAIAAVSQWRFTPTYLNCEPVEVQMYVTVAFKLEQ